MANNERQLRQRYGVALAILLLVLVCFLRWKSKRANGTRNAVIAVNTVQPSLPLLLRGVEETPTTGKLEANNVGSTKARKLIATALRAVLHAKSYRIVMTSAYSNGGAASFTFVHVKSAVRGDLFRTDTVNFDASMKPVPGLSRVEITNERGNWDMGDSAGKEGIAFLLTDNQDPVNTVGLYKAFEKDAQRIDSVENLDDYTATNSIVENRPVVSISRKVSGAVGSVYTLDATSGNLLSIVDPGANFRQDFELDPAIDVSEFNIPDSLVVAPVRNVSAAEQYLLEHK
jgi:hypothetical protein